MPKTKKKSDKRVNKEKRLLMSKLRAAKVNKIKVLKKKQKKKHEI